MESLMERQINQNKNNANKVHDCLVRYIWYK